MCVFLLSNEEFSTYCDYKFFKIDFLLIVHKIFLLLWLHNFWYAVWHYELYLLGCHIPTDILEPCSGMHLCYLKTFGIFQVLLLIFFCVARTVFNLGLIAQPIFSNDANRNWGCLLQQSSPKWIFGMYFMETENDLRERVEIQERMAYKECCK